MKTKSAFVLSVCTAVIFHFRKSSYFYLHQDMLHDEKGCKTAMIENNRALILLICPTKPTE